MANQVGFEIDFLPVGNGERSGDAIALRYGTPGNYTVMVYDGGTKEAGQQLVEHITRYYGTDRVDYVINSHPDADHASGLSVVLEELEVGGLWMHQPWKYSSVILDYFKDGRLTDNSLADRLKNKMGAAYNLEQLAEERGIPIYEPFCGTRVGDFFVLSPEREWYIHDLIAEFEKSPEQKRAAESSFVELARYMLKATSGGVATVVSWVAEEWGIESLRDNVTTSAENESSIILFGEIAGQGILLTGDAGVRALTATADYAERKGVSLPQIVDFFQIPHHGSRRNVSTPVLDRIVGSRKAFDDGRRTKTAFVSTSEHSTTHPRKAVVNALLRRGANVVTTKGSTKHYYYNMLLRKGWGSAELLSFSNQVEPWD